MQGARPPAGPARRRAPRRPPRVRCARASLEWVRRAWSCNEGCRIPRIRKEAGAQDRVSPEQQDGVIGYRCRGPAAVPRNRTPPDLRARAASTVADPGPMVTSSGQMIHVDQRGTIKGRRPTRTPPGPSPAPPPAPAGPASSPAPTRSSHCAAPSAAPPCASSPSSPIRNRSAPFSVTSTCPGLRPVSRPPADRPRQPSGSTQPPAQRSVANTPRFDPSHAPIPLALHSHHP